MVRISYKVVDLRGSLPGDPNGNWDTSTKTLGVVQHHNGPPVPAWAWDDPVGWIKVIVRGHQQYGRFAAGWTFTGQSAYHEFVFGDTIYRTNNYGATLPHCGNREWNYRSLAMHIAIGGSQRADKRTLQTAAERAQDHLDAIGVGKSGFKGHQEVGSSNCPGTLMGDLVLPFRRGEDFGDGETEDPVTVPPGTEKIKEVLWAINGRSDAWHQKVAKASAQAMRAVGVKSRATKRNLHSIKRAMKEEGVYCVVVGDEAAKGAERHLPDLLAQDALDSKGVVRLADDNIRNESRWRISDLCGMGGLDETVALNKHTEVMGGKAGENKPVKKHKPEDFAKLRGWSFKDGRYKTFTMEPSVRRIAAYMCNEAGVEPSQISTYEGENGKHGRHGPGSAIDVLFADEFGKMPTEKQRNAGWAAYHVLKKLENDLVDYAVWDEIWNEWNNLGDQPYNPNWARGSWIMRMHKEHIHISGVV